MTRECIAGVAFLIAIASVAAAGQETDVHDGPKLQSPRERVFVRTDRVGGIMPSRHLTIRSDDGRREIVTEIIETLSFDGRFKSSLETTTETIRSTPDAWQMKRDVVGFGAHGERTLLETTQSEHQTLPDGTVTILQSTWTPDLNRRLRLTSRQIQHKQSISPDNREIDTVIYRIGIEGALQESESIRQTERSIRPDVLRRESTRLVRDANGRLQPAETRSQDVRIAGGSEYLEAETIHRPDVDGDPILSERAVIRRVSAGAADQTVTETFSRNVAGLMESGSRLELTRRVRRTVTVASDGSVRVIEEIEERIPGSPGEPIRPVRRTVETIRKVDAERWATDVQVFHLDLNGRFVLTAVEAGEATGGTFVRH